jgi:hypothetical protein
MEKILISAPTAAAKNYCLEKWLLNINSFTYPKFKVVLFDNTVGGTNKEHIYKTAERLCLKYDLSVFNVDLKGSNGLIDNLCRSHNAVRQYALDNKYDHLLHLETDVMPEPDVIERLLSHRKKVVGALYYRDEGRSRKLMVQKNIMVGPISMATFNFDPEEDVHFVDGDIKKVPHVGLGCALIDTIIFDKIKFRYKNGIDTSPDTYFAEDCFRNKIDIFADTSLICEHDNTAWGKFGVDYN